MAPLPDGYTLRPPRVEDTEAVADMINAETQALIGIPLVNTEWVESMWTAPSVDRSNDVLVVVAPDGTMAGTLSLQSSPPHTRIMAIGAVSIEHHGRGIGGALVDESERRSERFVALAPKDEEVLLHIGSLADEPMVAGLLSSRGYREVRRFWQMTIMFDGEPPPPGDLEGFDLRLLQPGEENEVYSCMWDAFQDHWGDGFSDLEDWRHRHVEVDSFDPGLWTLAWHGTELAGAVVGVEVADEDADCGYVAEVGVRPAYRRRGVGEALLRASFGQFYRTGRAGALLHVDAESLTGATRLYERVGMTAQPRFSTWEKQLRPGAATEAGG